MKCPDKKEKGKLKKEKIKFTPNFDALAINASQTAGVLGIDPAGAQKVIGKLIKSLKG